MSATPQNLFQFALENSNDEFANPSDLAILLNAIGAAGKFISSEINRAALRDIFGSVGAANVTGMSSRNSMSLATTSWQTHCSKPDWCAP